MTVGEATTAKYVYGRGQQQPLFGSTFRLRCKRSNLGNCKMSALVTSGCLSFLDLDSFVSELLGIDASIRYVAVVNNEYHLLASKQKQGVPSFTTGETDRNFMSIMPPIIVDAVEKLRPFLGELQGVSVRYEKSLLIFHRAGNLIVVMGFGPEVLTPFLTKIGKEFEKLKKQYMT